MMSFLASVSLPGGLWSSLINTFHSGIGNFGWTIFLLTIVIKLITSPLDFWSKLNTKRQSLIQQKCAPQIAKIKKKFGENQQAIRVQTNALYKKEGLNTGVGCVVTLLHLVLSLVIFFTFYSSLRANSAYQAINQYEILETTYNDKAYEILLSRADEIDEIVVDSYDKADEFTKYYAKGRDLVNAQNEESAENEESTENNVANAEGEENIESIENSEETPLFNDEECIALFNKYNELMNDVQNQAENAVLDKWNTIKSNWLWIANIWVSDAPVEPFLSYSGLVKIANSGGTTYKNYVAENVNANSFTSISNLVNTRGSRTRNGYYILAILAAGITFLSQYVAEAHNKLKNKKAKQVANASMGESLNYSMKMMKFIMPIIMIFFVLQSSASFGIYIVASNIITILIGEIINLIVNRLTRKKQKEVEEVLEKEANRLIKKGKLQEKK